MKKTLSTFLIATVITTVSFAPIFSYAQTATGINQPASNSEALANGNGSSGAGKAAVTSLASAASCSVGTLLSNVLTSAISAAVKKLATKAVTSAVGSPGAPAVPTEISKGDVKDNSNVTTLASTGSVAPGGILDGVSWDAIAFCVGNALIQYIGNSVTNWINGGFQGNPAFVANPKQFFSDIADQTAGDFIGQLSGTAGQAIGQGVNGFQQAITRDLVGTYNSSYLDAGSMTLGQYIPDPQGFMNGSSQTSLGGYLGVAMGPGNSYISALQNSRDAFASNLAYNVGSAANSYNLNRGYRSVQNCQTNPDGSAGPCKTTVPGSDIQQAGQDARNLSNLRLVAAQKFDQVVSSLVNEMIKVALNKLLTSTSKK